MNKNLATEQDEKNVGVVEEASIVTEPFRVTFYVDTVFQEECSLNLPYAPLKIQSLSTKHCGSCGPFSGAAAATTSTNKRPRSVCQYLFIGGSDCRLHIYRLHFFQKSHQQNHKQWSLKVEDFSSQLIPNNHFESNVCSIEVDEESKTVTVASEFGEIRVY